MCVCIYRHICLFQPFKKKFFSFKLCNIYLLTYCISRLPFSVLASNKVYNKRKLKTNSELKQFKSDKWNVWFIRQRALPKGRNSRIHTHSTSIRITCLKAPGGGGGDQFSSPAQKQMYLLNFEWEVTAKTRSNSIANLQNIWNYNWLQNQFL